MYKIGIIGKTQTVSLFSALGYTVMDAATEQDARALLERAVKGGEYAVLCLEECYAAALAEELARYAKLMLPAIVVLPGTNGSMGLGADALKRAMERAIGTDMP